jgi:hypothetical protein
VRRSGLRTSFVLLALAGCALIIPGPERDCGPLVGDSRCDVILDSAAELLAGSHRLTIRPWDGPMLTVQEPFIVEGAYNDGVTRLLQCSYSGERFEGCENR